MLKSWVRKVASFENKHAGALVLMYHRIASSDVDPWSLCVSPEHFGEQLAVLKRQASPVPLSALYAERVRRKTTRPLIALTFDDGYADNLLTAVPMLARAHIPAAMFVTTGGIGGAREFWWDELERLLLHPGDRPESLELRIGDDVHSWEFGEAASYSTDTWLQLRSWKTSAAAPGPRQALYLSLWQLLQLRPFEEQQAAIEALSAWASEPAQVREAYRTMSPDEVVALAESDGIEIGAHTVTHPVLAHCSRTTQKWEVEESKRHLESLTGRVVRHMTYPHGARTEETLQVVDEAGYALGCTTRVGLVSRETPPLEIPRVQVEDWSGPDFEQKLQAWLSGTEM